MWLRWSHHCIYLTNDHSNVPYVVPEHLNSPVYFVLWCPPLFPWKIDVRCGCFIYCIYIYFWILVSNEIWCGAGSANLSGAPLLLSGVQVEWLLVFCIMFYGSLFVLLWYFHFPFVLSVLWFTASDYPYGIIKLFSLKHVMFSVEENKQRFNINNNIL